MKTGPLYPMFYACKTNSTFTYIKEPLKLLCDRSKIDLRERQMSEKSKKSEGIHHHFIVRTVYIALQNIFIVSMCFRSQYA